MRALAAGIGLGLVLAASSARPHGYHFRDLPHCGPTPVRSCMSKVYNADGHKWVISTSPYGRLTVLYPVVKLEPDGASAPIQLIPPFKETP